MTTVGYFMLVDEIDLIEGGAIIGALAAFAVIFLVITSCLR